MSSAGNDLEGRNRQVRHQDLDQDRGRDQANGTLDLLPLRATLRLRNHLVIRLVLLRQEAVIAERNQRRKSEERNITGKRKNAVIVDIVKKTVIMTEMASKPRLTVEGGERKGILKNERRPVVGKVAPAEVKKAITMQKISKPVK